MMVPLANTRDDPDEELRAVAELHRRRVDGITLMPSAGPDAAALACLRDNSIPAVLVDQLPDAGFDGIGVENTASVGALVDHLADRGHVRIGLVAGQASFTTTRERVDGVAALRRRGIAADAGLVSEGHVEVATARAATAQPCDGIGRRAATMLRRRIGAPSSASRRPSSGPGPLERG